MVSKGLLSPKNSVSQTVESTESAVISPVLPTVIPEIITPPVPSMELSSLGINLSHPVFLGYDFTKNKRFPRAITLVLNGFVQTITNKIDSKNLSADNRDSLYKQIFSVLKTEMKIQTDIKEQKIIRYI